jgi:uncharacterized protein YhjY with autotransporter beta-barrel domain
MFRNSVSAIKSAVVLFALLASLPGTAAAQAAAAQTLKLDLPGATPLQQLMGDAVFNMCAAPGGLLSLEGNYKYPQQADLTTQCTAIATAGNLGNPVATTPQALLGAIQQVSGNEISTQGALALRVGAGQFANISGRLDALRLGGNVSLSQNLAAFQDSAAPGGALTGGTQTFSVANDPTLQGGGFAPYTAQPQSARAGDGLMYASYFSDSDGGVRTLRSDTSGGAGAAGGGGVAGAVPNPWGLYVQGSYNSGHHDLTNNEDPFDFHAASVTAGLDYNFGSGVLGASVGYDDYDAGLRTSGLLVSGGSAQVQATSGSLYGAWFGQNWTFNGIATYGGLTTDLTRVVKYNLVGICLNDCTAVDRTLKGSPDGRSFAIGATAGYQVQADSWDIVPSLSVNYRRITIDSFTESDPTDPSDGLPLSFGDQTIESLRSVVALDLSRPVSVSFGVVTPIIRVEWDHEFKNGAQTINAHYAFDPTAGSAACLSCVALPTDAPVANYGIVALGLSVTLARRVQAFVYDEALFGYSDYHSNAVTVGVRGQF